MGDYIDRAQIRYNRSFNEPIVSKYDIDWMPRAKVVEREKIEKAIEEIKHCEVKGLWKPNYKEGFNDAVRECLDILKKHIGDNL